MWKTDRSRIAVAVLYCHRFRVDGQVRNLPRRPRFCEIHGGSDQAEHGRFAGPGLRDGSGQGRPVFIGVGGHLRRARRAGPTIAIFARSAYSSVSMRLGYLYFRYPVLSQTFCDAEMLALEQLGLDLELGAVYSPHT